MCRLLTLVILISAVYGCHGKKDARHKPRRPLDESFFSDKPVVTEDSIQSISDAWKRDSLGCLKLRDPRKMTWLIEHFELVGKDTSVLIQYLGKPNHLSLNEGIKNYTYFTECIGEEKYSYSNFDCFFSADTLWYCHHTLY